MAILPHTYAVGVVSGYFEPGGKYGGHSGYYEWVNYCPNCHHHNCLSKHLKPCPEGQISCTRCGSDYDGCTGIDKWGGSYIRGQLTAYVEPEPTPTTNDSTTNMTTNMTTSLTPFEVAQNCLMTNKIL